MSEIGAPSFPVEGVYPEFSWIAPRPGPCPHTEVCGAVAGAQHARSCPLRTAANRQMAVLLGIDIPMDSSERR